MRVLYSYRELFLTIIVIGIYKITSPKGKVYIGQSIDLERRWRQYRTTECKNQIKLWNSFKKHGIDNHTFKILEQCSVESLNTRERYWQDYYNTLIEGLNLKLTKSTDKSGEASKETKNRMSVSQTGRVHSKDTKDKISEANKGRDLTQEHKRKISEANKGKILSEETKQKISDSCKKRSKEVIDKIANSNRGGKRSEETKKRMSVSQTGKHVSEETIKKIIETRKKNWEARGCPPRKFSEETRQKMSLSKKDKPQSQAWLDSRRGKKRCPHSEERKKKMSEGKNRGIVDTRTGIVYESCKQARQLLKCNVHRNIKRGILTYLT